jgi:tetratricopeptide (TPR) repeat protein
VAVSAQDPDAQREKLQQLKEQQEQSRQLDVRREFDAAKALTDAGQYQEADEKYRFVLANIRSVPSDLAFFFGKNSYYLQQYRQGIDWLNKYVQLKGTSGQYFQEATEVLKLAEAALVQTRKEETKAAEEILSTSYDIDCGPSGKVTCPVCNGQTVIIKATHLGTTYRACGYCNQTGTLSCSDYNKLVRGELKPKN